MDKFIITCAQLIVAFWIHIHCQIIHLGLDVMWNGNYEHNWINGTNPYKSLLVNQKWRRCQFEPPNLISRHISNRYNVAIGLYKKTAAADSPIQNFCAWGRKRRKICWQFWVQTWILLHCKNWFFSGLKIMLFWGSRYISSNLFSPFSCSDVIWLYVQNAKQNLSKMSMRGTWWICYLVVL